ncbi:alpha/beta hydrolase [Parvularcula flava]|uniref:Alpha/beta hydrolase n=1 Tax=Aquisalinus luteolus TaxID=1566827 RepID=A0A8J3A3L8_9PROT|nr:alpha/beta hydrolase [Aquisalinus luteolus]NHK29007.1 alpha/beta hydrolase [Aquisalinus luteolus]GGI00597.1 endo-1,4-beta-xylanase [Aquisalinus luteolus]
MSVDRRQLLGGLAVGAAGSLAGCASAVPQSATVRRPDTDDLLVDPDREPDEIIPLWPDGVPGVGEEAHQNQLVERAGPGEMPNRAYFDIAEPHLAVFRASQPDGSALMIMPGGGYARVVIDKEGYEGARWFSRRGMTVFVLFYRLPGQNGGAGWAAGADAPLQDAQRAMRIIRHRSSDFGIAPDRIAALGFSAGGHLSGSLATRFDIPVYEPVDAADAQSARPDLSGLAYPVVTMAGPHVHGGSRDNLLGPSPSPEAIETYSVEQAIRPDTPPLFVFHSSDDASVPVENALALYEGARREGVPVDLHVFPTGGHGYGFRISQKQTAAGWPGLFDQWRRRAFV